jgi:hypothetical protein
MQVTHLTLAELDAGTDRVLASPSDEGTVEMVVRRPDVDAREVLEEGELLVGEGLAGDNYLARGSSSMPDGAAHPEAQINIMNSRAVDLVAGGDRDRWPLAGDQLFVDLDLTTENLPAGTRLRVGTAVLEVARKPHNGCQKFSARFGVDAVRWVNADRSQRRRGLNAMVVEGGVVHPGDPIVKLA